MAGSVAHWKKNLKFVVTTSNDSTLVVSRGVKRTAGQLAAGEATKIRSRPQHMQRLAKIDNRNQGKPKIKVKFAATDEFGQTATEVVKLKLLVRGGRVVVFQHDEL